MIEQVAQFLAKAKDEPVDVPILEVLNVWGFTARTWQNCSKISRDLSAEGLGCDPDLFKAGHRSVVRVGPVETTLPGLPNAEEQPDKRLQLPVALLVRQIPSAINGVERVPPDYSLGQAQFVMSARKYSQLAVMSGDRDLIGYISWQSIAQRKLGKPNAELDDVTIKPAPEVRADQGMLGQLGVIYEYGFVFVRGDDDRICGIVTTADLTYQFRDLTTPFFQLGEIEGRLRRHIDLRFGADELRDATGDRKLNSADDMDFGQYIKLLGDEEHWKRIGFGYDQVMFIYLLNEARKVRNKVMHFGRALTVAERGQLEQCLDCIRAIDPLP